MYANMLVFLILFLAADLLFLSVHTAGYLMMTVENKTFDYKLLYYILYWLIYIYYYYLKPVNYMPIYMLVYEVIKELSTCIAPNAYAPLACLYNTVDDFKILTIGTADRAKGGYISASSKYGSL